MFVCCHCASVSDEFPLLRLPHSSGPRFERADSFLNLQIVARNYAEKNPRTKNRITSTYRGAPNLDHISVAHLKSKDLQLCPKYESPILKVRLRVYVLLFSLSSSAARGGAEAMVLAA